MNFAKPTIVKSPFGENLAIAYPYTTDGKWMHKDETEHKYFTVSSLGKGEKK